MWIFVGLVGYSCNNVSTAALHCDTLCHLKFFLLFTDYVALHPVTVHGSLCVLVNATRSVPVHPQFGLVCLFLDQIMIQ